MISNDLSRSEDLVPSWGERIEIEEVGNAIYEELLKMVGTDKTLKISDRADLLRGLPYDCMVFRLLFAYLGRLAVKDWYIFVMAPVIDQEATGYSTFSIVFGDIEMKLCPMMEPGLISSRK